MSAQPIQAQLPSSAPLLLRMQYDLVAMRFKCPKCDRRDTCGNIRVHARVEHKIFFTVPLTCPFCPETFRTDKGLSHHMASMKGKCTLNEQADLAAQVVAAKQRSTLQTSSGPAKDARAKTKGNGSGAATKKGSTDMTTNKVQSGRVTKPAAKKSEGPRQWRPSPDDEEPTVPCPVCERKFYNRTGVARHLNEKSTGALCMERLKNDPAIQAKVLTLARPYDPPAKGEWRVRCPWCASHYEHPNGVRAHMMSHHPDLYKNVIWVHKEDFPNAIELVWAEKRVLEAEGRSVHFPNSDVEMRTPGEPGSDYDSSDDKALFVLARSNRSRSRSSTSKPSQQDDPSLAPMAAENKPRVADKIGKQSSGAGTPTQPIQQPTTVQAPVATIPVKQQPTAKPHICPWCNTGIAAVDQFKLHLLQCIGPFTPALQQQDTRPIMTMGPTTNNMWKCPWCPAYFAAKPDVETHISTMHAEQAVQVIFHWILDWKVKIKCPCCLFSFAGEKMKTHLAEQHEGQRVVWASEEKQHVSEVQNAGGDTGPLEVNVEEEDKKIVLGCSKNLPIILEDGDDEEMDTDTDHGDSPLIPSFPAASAAPIATAVPAPQEDEQPAPVADMEGNQDVVMAQDESNQDAAHGHETALSLETRETDSQPSMAADIIPAPVAPAADGPTQTPVPAVAAQVTPSPISDEIAIVEVAPIPATTTQGTPAPAAVVASSPVTPAPVPVPGSSSWQAIAIDGSASTPTLVAPATEPAHTTASQAAKPELVRQCVRMGCREPPLPGMSMCTACDTVYGDEEW